MSSRKEFDFSSRHFDKLRHLAYEYSGIQVSDDKYEMYYARLAKRLRAQKLSDFDAYIKQVTSDANEFREFINAITTNVTSFQREPHHFEFLKALLATWQKPSIHIWSAGCSSGQEPYSILVNILPVCEARNIKVMLRATDLDTEVLARAAEGVYPLDAVDVFNLEQKKRFFLKGKGSQAGKCRLKPKVRALVEFEQLNLINAWSSATKYDVIFCRNVMIYFDNNTKSALVARFHASLAPQGWLFLGHSESLPRTTTGWRTEGKNIYRRCDGHE